jgi:hypothetical protein
MRADDLLELATAYAQALDLSLIQVGRRACGNTNVFARLAEGHGCNSRTIERASAWFTANWPSDLEWPASVPRPTQDVAA